MFYLYVLGHCHQSATCTRGALSSGSLSSLVVSTTGLDSRVTGLEHRLDTLLCHQIELSFLGSELPGRFFSRFSGFLPNIGTVRHTIKATQNSWRNRAQKTVLGMNTKVYYVIFPKKYQRKAHGHLCLVYSSLGKMSWNTVFKDIFRRLGVCFVSLWHLQEEWSRRP